MTRRRISDEEATQAEGTVSVLLETKGEFACIHIEDNGTGMSEEFIRTQLFKPFNTTKGNAGMGIGVFEAKQFVEEVDGQIKVKSEVDSGTCFSLILPLPGSKKTA